jgi:hypothetical protein
MSKAWMFFYSHPPFFPIIISPFIQYQWMDDDGLSKMKIKTQKPLSPSTCTYSYMPIIYCLRAESSCHGFHAAAGTTQIVRAYMHACNQTDSRPQQASSTGCWEFLDIVK